MQEEEEACIRRREGMGAMMKGWKTETPGEVKLLASLLRGSTAVAMAPSPHRWTGGTDRNRPEPGRHGEVTTKRLAESYCFTLSTNTNNIRSKVLCVFPKT